MEIAVAIAVATLATLSPGAWAQVPAEAEAHEGDPASVRRAGDPSADRNVLLPTAETLPKGAIAFNGYELLLAGLSYGVTDRVELSATTLLPITSDIPFVLATSLKWNFHRSGQGLVSVMPSVTIISDRGSSISAVRLTLIGDRILDQAGRVALTGGAMTQLVFGGSGGDLGLLILWAALSARMGEHVKFLGEVILPGGYSWAGSGKFELVQEATVLGYGLRFFGRTVAVDLSFLRPLDPNVDVGSLVMGVPWVAFSAQF